MPVDIKNVLVCDAVDSVCVDLLKQNGINVSVSCVFFIIFLFAILIEIYLVLISYKNIYYLLP